MTEEKKQYGTSHSIHIPNFKDNEIFKDTKEFRLFFWELVKLMPVNQIPLKFQTPMIYLKQHLKKKYNKEFDEIEYTDKEFDLMFKQLEIKKGFFKQKALKKIKNL